MANDYFNFTAGLQLVRNTKARAEAVNAIATAIETGFALFPGAAGLSLNYHTYAADTGVANAMIINLAQVPTAYVTGMQIATKVVANNTGATTVNVNSLGVRSVLRANGNALAASDLLAGMVITMRYDGTAFRVIGVVNGDLVAAAASAAAAATSETNAATSETNAATSATNAATSETNAAASASAASTSETNAAASAAAASTSETNAGTSETNAAASAAAAATSETNAGTSETNAAASAAAASTSETNAGTSETNAAASEAAAAASYDSFDDRYLGAKASDPTLDNDGNALLTGALYWNTALVPPRMRSYTGAAWADVAGDLTTVSQTIRSTYGGTADAITLTTGLGLTALTTGAKFRTRATATNTGAMTANVDGIGLVTVKTITGADTPAGYIRTDVDTEFLWDGTNLIADRQLEYDSNSNGHYERRADGVMDCFANITYDAGSEVAGYRGSWTFPAAYTATPSFSHYPAEISGPSGTGEAFIFGDTSDTQSGTVSGFFVRRYAGFMRTMKIRHIAKGLWY